MRTVFLSISLALLSLGTALASPQNGFVGETQKYKVWWAFIPAGEITLESGPQTEVNSVPALHFSLKARTYPALDLIYKFREQVDSYMDLEMSRSLLYRKKMVARSKRDVEVTFDWQQGQARYTNFNKSKEPIAVPAGTLDPLAALYFLRTLEFSEEMVMERPVTDGKKVVMGTAKVLGREEITVNGVTYDTFRVEPDMRDVRGVFEQSKDSRMLLWISADQRRLLVKIKSKVMIGSFRAEIMP